jgi:hypothetical protein
MTRYSQITILYGVWYNVLETRYGAFTHLFPRFRYFRGQTTCNPYLAGSDFRPFVRPFSDDGQAKDVLYDRFCTLSETFYCGALKNM